MTTTTVHTIHARRSTAHVGLERTVTESWPEYSEAHWYAAYTSPNHEKRVAEQLGARSVEHFLPVYASVRRWKDRRVTLELPLFPGYVFVWTALRDRLKILQIPGVARLVGFNGKPVALPREEIEAVRATLAAKLLARPHSYLIAGQRLRIKRGPLAGLEGVLLRRKGGCRIVFSIHLLRRSIAVDADLDDLDLLPLAVRSLPSSLGVHEIS